MPDLLLRGARLARGDGALSPGDIRVRGERLVAVGDRLPTAPGDVVVDVTGRVLSPGLVDLHVHGAGGHAFEDPGAAERIARDLARVGVTSVQASLVSATTAELAERLAAFAPLVGPRPARAAVLGVHLEGPFLAAGQRGAHAASVLRSPTDADRSLLGEHAGVVTMVTLAPEVDGVLDLVGPLAGAGTVVALGHSDATAAQVRAAQRAGATHVTHLWSGQSSVRREGPWRVPGMLEAALAATGMTAEVIADGRHLPPELLEIARRCLGPDLVVVSDATAGAGMPEGYRYRLGEIECVVADGVGMVDGAPSFGGSTTALPGMVRHLARDLGWPLGEVLRTVTSAPARVLGREGDIGVLAPGARADLVLWDEDVRVERVWVGGSEVRARDTASG
ncbi:N-acetylglucosamine-6-phosphate deacetylase [Beutenbergia cavernae DSM 12333]|uniref:N-acetylglucosamine-6-phosphate deacetylase n=1 Tax=Beutenbergia cavernae (strain ATCC BAA-8 / DSM 12333 / CCUG 43141 / JCM 11478 / NBRC 16432 / NCIMB 13614 / HKI 0122) TaxID=471853 RepID=C5BXW1_BEUC1|nr:amidohydrolase family protein [Beutenbergia cavernae]ACQ78855.1 N-acetylglucosamine-6-phosphate deacetylase [Beutenbergia cavernae DSM 12333]